MSWRDFFFAGGDWVFATRWMLALIDSVIQWVSWGCYKGVGYLSWTGSDLRFINKSPIWKVFFLQCNKHFGVMVTYTSNFISSSQYHVIIWIYGALHFTQIHWISQQNLNWNANIFLHMWLDTHEKSHLFFTNAITVSFNEQQGWCENKPLVNYCAKICLQQFVT